MNVNNNIPFNTLNEKYIPAFIQSDIVNRQTNMMLLDTLMPFVSSSSEVIKQMQIYNDYPVRAILENHRGPGNMIHQRDHKIVEFSPFDLRQSYKISWEEKKLYENQLTTPEMFYNLATRAFDGIRATTEKYIASILQSGTFILSENGYSVNLDYKVPSGQKIDQTGWAATAKWSDTTNSDPLTNIQTWIRSAQANDNMATPLYIITSLKVINEYLLVNSKIKQAIFGTDKKNQPLTLTELNRFLESKGMPMIVSYTSYILDTDETTKLKLWNDQSFVIIGTEQLGNTYNVEPEPVIAARNPGATVRVTRSQSGIYLLTYDKKRDELYAEIDTYGTAAAKIVPYISESKAKELIIVKTA